MAQVAITVNGDSGVILTLQGPVTDDVTLAALKQLTDKLSAGVLDTTTPAPV